VLSLTAIPPLSPASALPTLDGWRGVAIALVLFSHATGSAAIAPDALVTLSHSTPLTGAVGVQIFFCISGFLITHLLLREESRHGRIAWGNFFARRALRLFPTYFAYLAVIALAGAWLQWELTWRNFAPSLLFSQGVWWRRYEIWEFSHFWSLALEQQFYLLWPLAFLFCPRHRRTAFVLGLLAGLPLLRAGLLTIGFEFPLGQPLVRYADFLLAGCWLGLVWENRAAVPGLAACLRHPRAAEAAGLAVVAAVWLAVHQGEHAGLGAAFRDGLDTSVAATLQAAGSTVAIACTVAHPAGWLARLLQWPPLAGLGVISYGTYVWQQPFLNPQPHAAWLVFPLNVAVALAAGLASYFLWEKHFLRLKARLSF